MLPTAGTVQDEGAGGVSHRTALPAGPTAACSPRHLVTRVGTALPASQHAFWALQQNLPAEGSEPRQYLTCWVRGCLPGPVIALELRSPGSARLGAPEGLLGPPVGASS